MENNMISSFSERLKELRAEKGIRSEDAAEVFGVSRATLSAYEMGKSVPDLNVLNKMAKRDSARLLDKVASNA